MYTLKGPESRTGRSTKQSSQIETALGEIILFISGATRGNIRRAGHHEERCAAARAADEDTVACVPTAQDFGLSCGYTVRI